MSALWPLDLYALNPRLTANDKRTYSELDKTDRIDAFVTADRLRMGRDLPPPFHYDERFLPLRLLTPGTLDGRVWGNPVGRKLPGAWGSAPKRWPFNTLWRPLRIELWQHPDFRATCARSRTTWLHNDPLCDNLFNTILASART